MYTQVGTVTTRRHARVHLAIHGRAYCGAGSGRILGPSRSIAASDRNHLCRRCAHAFADRLRMDYNLVSRRRDRGSRILASALEVMIDQVDPLRVDEVAQLRHLATTLDAWAA